MATVDGRPVSPMSASTGLEEIQEAQTARVVSIPPAAHGARFEENSVDGRSAAAAGPSQFERDDASSADFVNEKEAGDGLTRWQKIRAHFWRKKWWYLLGLVIFLAILLPILFEVIIPAIVQNIVNSQSLPINSGIFRAHSPTQLIVSLNTTLDTPLGVDIDPVDLYLTRPPADDDDEEHPSFLKLGLPGQHVKGKTDILVTNQTVDIADQKELITWFTDVFEKKDVKLAVSASPKVNLGALNYDPSIKKTLEVPALNHLAGFGVQDLKFNFSNDTENNLSGKVNLPNSGALTLGLGNLTFNMMAGEVRIGLLTVYDVDLYPGENLRDFEGELFFSELVPNIAAILASQSNALSSGRLELAATGNATIVRGEHIPYVEEVLKDRRLVFHLSIMSLLVDLAGNALGGGEGSLTEVIGDVFGNSTLMDQIGDYWNDEEEEDEEEGEDGDDGVSGKETIVEGLKAKLRRVAPRASLAMNVMKLGARARK